MSRFTARVWVIGLCGLLLVSCSSPSPDSLEGIWDEYVGAFKEYQNRLYQFGSERWPDMERVLKLQKEYQLAKIKLREDQFRFLKREHPDQLITDQSVHDLIHFEWSDRFDTALYRRFPEAKSRAERVDRLRGESQNDTAWPTLRRRFRSLPPDSEYAEIQREYQDRLNQLNEAFARISEQ